MSSDHHWGWTPKTNQHGGPCFYCKSKVGAGKGFTHPVAEADGTYKAFHMDCLMSYVAGKPKPQFDFLTKSRKVKNSYART